MRQKGDLPVQWAPCHGNRAVIAIFAVRPWPAPLRRQCPGAGPPERQTRAGVCLPCGDRTGYDRVGCAGVPIRRWKE